MDTLFAQVIYEKLLEVPRGRVTTYGDLARALDSRAYQAVGQALRNNPYAPHVPCHRVVKADGRIGGFMGQTNGTAIAKKKALLQSEGVQIKNGQVLDFSSVRHQF